MLLMIDNYDSFTFNIVQMFLELEAKVTVIKNDELSVKEIEALEPERIVVSPGPCAPDQAGVSVELIAYFSGKIPILGVCLGHQSIGQAFGCRIAKAKHIMHGKTSSIFHSGKGLFADIQNPFTATRYHSLVLERSHLSCDLEITAWTENEEGEIDEIMGVCHKRDPVFGVQFHPESILSECGHALFGNFLTLT